MKKILLIPLLLFFLSIYLNSAYSQLRVAVLPFENMDGLMEYNIWNYRLQDTVLKALKEADPNELNYRIIPIDSVEMALAELNIDPTSPQYKSDMWKAVKKLGASRLVMGNFNIQAGKFLFNVYVYDVRTRMRNPHYQVRNIFKKEENIYEIVPIIVENLKPAVNGN